MCELHRLMTDRLMFKQIKELASSVSEVFWPRCCVICGRQLAGFQHHLCESCSSTLPRIPAGYDGMKDRLGLFPNIVQAHGWLHYGRHEPMTRLLINIKYRGGQRLARHVGEQMAWELFRTGMFTGVDCIMPVPLHYGRLLKRGYNQSYELARGVSYVLNVPVINGLKARRHKSQTRMSPLKRLNNVEGAYYISSRSPLLGTPGYRHILLIDDVCTTGSTLRNCIGVLTEALPADVHISVLTLAMAH